LLNVYIWNDGFAQLAAAQTHMVEKLLATADSHNPFIFVSHAYTLDWTTQNGMALQVKALQDAIDTGSSRSIREILKLQSSNFKSTIHGALFEYTRTIT